MPTLTYLEDSFDCTTAIKGADYIHLLDESGQMIARFNGISDFSQFTLTDGEYTDPTRDHDCYIAVIRDDGTIGKGGHRCSDIGSEGVIKGVGEGLKITEDGTLVLDMSFLDEEEF